MDFTELAAQLGAVVLSYVEDGEGWRWRASWRGVQLGGWNDIDGVAVVADIGPWDEWVGLAGRPADPTPTEALSWAIHVLTGWLDDPANAERMAKRGAP